MFMKVQFNSCNFAGEVKNIFNYTTTFCQKYRLCSTGDTKVVDR